jgi:hypothetical protein
VSIGYHGALNTWNKIAFLYSYTYLTQYLFNRPAGKYGTICMVNDPRKKLMNKMCVVYKTVRIYFQCTRICNFGCEILVSDIMQTMYV